MMALFSLCKKCCQCCRKRKSNPENSYEVQRSVSNHEIINQEIDPMNLEEVESHCKDMKNIYRYALEAMQNFLGKPSYPYITQPKQLYPYILYLCEGLKDNEYVSIKDIISTRQLLNIQLTLKVKEAKVIHPKITEYSQIFCKLWINKGKEQLTSVKDSTAYLLWDETFVLDIENYECDIFHIEVWSSRPGLFEKLTNFSLDRLKDDDPLSEEKGMYFLGDAVEYIKSLPCVGQNILWTLKKGPRRLHTKGQVKIFAQLGTGKGQDYILHLHCHMAIMRLCYEKQMLTLEGYSDIWKNWLEILPNTALTLIQQHALQHGITPLEQCLCSWLVTSALKMRKEDRISFYLLRDLLGHLFENITEGSIGQMQEVLCKSVSDFSTFTLEILGDLHRHFDVHIVEMADELYYMLRCMSTVELKACTNFVESYQMIEDEASMWYLKIIADVKKELEVDDSIDRMVESLKNIMKIYLKNQIMFDDIFSRAWNISYSSVTYRKLDDVVCTTIQPMIKHLMIMLDNSQRKRNISETLKMLQLYHNVRNLVNYVMTCVPRKSIKMDEYSVWFGEEMALEWFLLCDIYTQPFIRRAVLADSMEKISTSILHGTSVPDVASIIDEMVIDVWMKLKWKDQFYTHGALIEAVKSCVLDYNKIIMKRIKIESFYCPVRDFEVCSKLCVALSNIYAMCEHLNKTKKKITKELETAETALGFAIPDPLITIQSEMLITTAQIYLSVFEKINKRIKYLVKSTVKPTSDFTNNFSGNLCLYIDNSLEVLYCNLKFDAFHIILRHMWIVLLKRLKSGLKYSEGCFVTCKKRLNIYMLTLQTLNQMKNIFFCDGHGLSHYEMENKICKYFQTFNSMSTEKVQIIISL